MPEEKILLVDDDPDVLRTLSRFLTGQGYQVAGAASGWEALEVLREDTVAVAVLDLMLPDLSGLDLLAHSRQHSPDTEVILFTGLGGLDSAIQALRLGAYDYLVKSELRLPELQSVVERALERRRLALANRELLEHLRQAREEVAATRARELVQIRRIGETLAQPHTPQELVRGLLDLIWESLPLSILGIEFQGQENLAAASAVRHHPGLPPSLIAQFHTWLTGKLAQTAEEAPEEGGSRSSARIAPLGERRARGEASPPPPQVLQEPLAAGAVRGVVAAARDEPFSPEEGELFRIFALQGEAALRNVLLFAEVQSLAIRDGLTGLYNYRHFREVLDHQVEASRRYGWPLSLLFLDIDHFKQINDTHGHPEGDVVLKALARFLQSQVRHADVLCRYGGEEFVVLLPQTSAGQAHHLAERLRRGLARTPIPLSAGNLHITVSIGLSSLEGAMRGEDLLKAADANLYRAKETGRNRVCGPAAP